MLEQRLDEAVYALDNLWSALLDAGTVADADTQDFRDAVILCDVSYAARRRLDPRDGLAGATGPSFPP